MVIIHKRHSHAPFVFSYPHRLRNFLKFSFALVMQQVHSIAQTNCQIRFAITRAVSGFAGSASQLASSLRPLPLAMGGWRPLLLRSERAWLLARIAEKPDLTLRAVMAELAGRGTPASYGAVWRFFAREGVSFKKKPARQRARPAGRRPAAAAVEEVPGPA